MIDLHTHTTASDGSLSPTDLVATAARAGLAAIGITDHDTVEGLPEAALAARRCGIELVPGVELSVAHRHGRFHMLGYFVDYREGPLLERLRLLQRNRATRNDRMLGLLRDLGIDVTLDEVAAASGGGQIGRPHMAAVLVRKGAAADIPDAFMRYLGDGAPAYVPKDRITVQEGIDVIQASGGLAVLAHPDTLRLSDGALETELVALANVMGLDGMECWYSDFTPERGEALARMAERCGLLVTGGSDFHGSAHPGVQVGHVCGGRPAPDSLLEPLRERARAHRARRSPAVGA